MHNMQHAHSGHVRTLSSHASMDSAAQAKKVEEEAPITDYQLQVIKEGDDMRTYVMVKNVPNTYTQEKFEEEFKETHGGMYDTI